MAIGELDDNNVAISRVLHRCFHDRASRAGVCFPWFKCARLLLEVALLARKPALMAGSAQVLIYLACHSRAKSSNGDAGSSPPGPTPRCIASRMRLLEREHQIFSDQGSALDPTIGSRKARSVRPPTRDPIALRWRTDKALRHCAFDQLPRVAKLALARNGPWNYNRLGWLLCT